jgi:hypothetical protein
VNRLIKSGSAERSLNYASNMRFLRGLWRKAADSRRDHGSVSRGRPSIKAGAPAPWGVAASIVSLITDPRSTGGWPRSFWALLLLRGMDATGRRHAARRHRQSYFVAHRTGKPRGRARCVSSARRDPRGAAGNSRSYRDSRLCVAAFGDNVGSRPMTAPDPLLPRQRSPTAFPGW